VLSESIAATEASISIIRGIGVQDVELPDQCPDFLVIQREVTNEDMLMQLAKRAELVISSRYPLWQSAFSKALRTPSLLSRGKGGDDSADKNHQ